MMMMIVHTNFLGVLAKLDAFSIKIGTVVPAGKSSMANMSNGLIPPLALILPASARAAVDYF
jgi:hypothetical protein